MYILNVLCYTPSTAEFLSLFSIVIFVVCLYCPDLAICYYGDVLFLPNSNFCLSKNWHQA